MKVVIRLMILLGLATFAGRPAAVPQAAARGPSLEVTVPAQVAVGAQVELTLTLRDVADFGGYEATLRFDTSAAHFNGMEHHADPLRRLGRDVGALGAVERRDGIVFGAYSCPVMQCVGLRQGPRQERGGRGTIPLATIDIIADRAGTLELVVDASAFVDAAGEPLAVVGARQTVRVHIGAPGAGPLHVAPAAGPSAATRPAAEVPGPFDLTGDHLVTHADLMEAALAWTLSREAGATCGRLADPTRDVNHDGCLTIADLQMVAAHYSPSGSPARPGLAGAPASLTVNSDADAADAQPGDGVCATSTGACTLRAAIAEANLVPGANTIAFAIPGGGVHTIALAQPLPTLSDETGPTTIDGYTQPGAKPNSDALLSDAMLQIQVKTTATITPATIEALHITSPDNSIRGLALFTFRRSIFAFGPAADNNVIAGNFIGTDAVGSYAAPAIADSGNGVELSQGASSNRIGGDAPADRNVISGNPKNGIATFNGGTDHNLIAGNLIGLGPNGQQLANISHGVDINSHSSYNIIGGSAAGERNVVSGNGAEGIEISHGQRTVGNQIVGNFIGTDVTGTHATPATHNGWHGVHIEDGPVDSIVSDNVVGNNGLGGVSIDGFETGFYPVGNHVANNRIGISLDGTPIPNARFGVQIADHSYQSVIGPNNIIAYNPIGVQVIGSDTDFNTITQNAIFGNTGLGIDLEPIGVTNPNDPDDADAGANEQLNFPVIARATKYQVTGTACITCNVEVFVADGGAGAYGQGKSFVGAAAVAADGTFTVNVSNVAVGDFVTATATNARGSTSEFARNLRVADAPAPPPDTQPVKRYLPVVRR